MIDDTGNFDDAMIYCQTVLSRNDFISDINITDEVVTRRNGLAILPTERFGNIS